VVAVSLPNIVAAIEQVLAQSAMQEAA
jgi:hypothetical protein